MLSEKKRLFYSSFPIFLFLLFFFFVLLPPSPAAAAYSLLLSSSPDRSNPASLEGSIVSGDIHVFTSPDEGVQRVSFYLDDPEMNGNPEQVENLAPYDFAGTAGNGNGQPYNTNQLVDGSHEITALVQLDSGAIETIISSVFDAYNTLSLPFVDNFNDGNSDGWIINDSGAGHNSLWEVVNGAYYQQNSVATVGASYEGTFRLGTYSFLIVCETGF